MSAKGKEFKVNVSTDRATAISSSAGSYPNVLYFPIDDDNVIIFNGNIYDWNASVTSPKLISSGDLNTYRGTQYLGVYYANYGNSISNKPSKVSQFALHVLLENNDSSTIQVLYSKNKIYTRAYESSSWSSWTEIGAGGITSIPQASSSALGGIKIGYSDNGRNYAVELDSSGKAYVNVPWTDTNTIYNVATTSANGLMSSSDKSKLDGIQAGADAVSFSRSLSSGTKIGTININGTNTDIYAPTAGEPVEYGVATSATLGLVRIGYPESGKNYPVELNSSNQMYVNVPWTDNNTTYSAGVGLSLSGTAFSLVKATPTTLGGVKVSSTEISTVSTVAATTFGSQNRIYPVQLAYPSGSAGTDGNKVLSVYVPWENTTYSVVSTSKNGLVSMDSALAELAYEDKDAGNLGSLARFGEMGMLEVSTIVEDDLALVNKSNSWTAYQDFKSGAGNSGSDMRFKREVTCMPDVLDNLMSLNVIKYIWEHPDENGIRCTFGVKADQLLSLGGVYATMVHSRADKYDTKWVEYDRFGVLAIKALQEVVMRNKQLESRIEYLEDTINSMRRVWEENS
jgi:hypothetical protein|nr:MAG TPA: Receptor recognition protein, Long tail, Helical sandwich, Tail fiber [Crassvirales sp.]